ncbi:MAG: hypothetical protein EAX81_03325 [Candidatus Thorarchaeota archaeon]|nr:hypothetical protein [Candidatus Thorarchaeota archaeon]
MMVDNALANLGIHWIPRGGDTGKRGAEHRGFMQLWFTHNFKSRSYTTGARIARPPAFLRTCSTSPSFTTGFVETEDFSRYRTASCQSVSQLAQCFLPKKLVCTLVHPNLPR